MPCNSKQKTAGATFCSTSSRTAIDAMVAVQFKDAMRQATEGCLARVALDLSRVGFLDSSGLGDRSRR
jgi:anti-sigma B factor antagonist